MLLQFEGEVEYRCVCVSGRLLFRRRADNVVGRISSKQGTLPYIRPAILTVMTTGTIASLKAFDIVQATTGGNFNTSTIANELYRKFFLEERDGLASALAVLLFIIVIPVVVLNQRGQKRAQEMVGA